MLRVFHGNRMEVLATQLAGILAEQPSAPLQTEYVAVQHPGMARWLSLRLADSLGVCANVAFPLPAAFIWKMFRFVLPDLPRSSSFEPKILLWRVLAVLDSLLLQPAFSELRAYLETAGGASRYELARRIADTFDQYLLYRPDWIQAWEDGGEDHWQARLWRSLVDDHDQPDDHDRHWVQLSACFLQALRQEAPGSESLPKRVSLFGIPTLSPGYFALLAELAESMEVYLFLLNPCCEYWFDIASRKQIARKEVQRTPGREYLESGNRLLASLGRQGQDWLEMVWERLDQDQSCFVPPERDSLLHCVQSDILQLREAGSGESLPGDDSLQVHSCHSPMREVEVLHDRLLSLFEQSPRLRPSDVVVMAPAIEDYAPYVEAVFGTADGDRRFPYSIADQGLIHQSRTVEVFLSLLALRWERFELEWVLDLLELTPVRARFGIGAEELQRLRSSLQEVGVRWGLDAEQRSALGFPHEQHNTWQAGLDRLLLGHALAGGDDCLYAGIAPWGGLEGAELRALGGLCVLLQRLREWLPVLQSAHSAQRWAQCLNGVLESLWSEAHADPAESRELHRLQQLIAGLQEHAGRGKFHGKLSALEVQSFFEEQLASGSPGGGFLGEGITFCRMIPMRCIPFQVICLLGMNFSSFPRSRHALSFNAMEQHPRRGDRSRRGDDRYLFLESLVSARRCFYLSYVGRDLHDNRAIPPSVLVSDLLDYLHRVYGLEGRELVLQHPLQPFSGRYFSAAEEDRRLYSYVPENLEMCRALAQHFRQLPEVPFLTLPHAEPALPELALEELLAFYQQGPARYFLSQRLEIRSPWVDKPIESNEPFALDPRQADSLCRQVYRLSHLGKDAAHIEALVRAEQALPHGAPGTASLQAQLRRNAIFQRRCAEQELEPGSESLAFDLELAGMHLHGRLQGWDPQQGLVDLSPHPLWPARKLALWLCHLVLAAREPGQQSRVVGLAQDGEFICESLAAVQQPLPLLTELIELYREGQRRPLRFFPRSSFAFAEAKNKSKDDSESLREARKSWESHWQATGEGENFYYRLAFRDTAPGPLEGEFAELSWRVLSPLLEHWRSGK